MGSSGVDNPVFAALVQATAGAGGGVFASIALQPIEVAKTRIQTGQAGDASTSEALLQILKTEGVAGLYRGSSAKCFETGSKNFVYFYIYDALSRAVKQHIRINTAVNLVLGYFAGVGTTTLTMPLEVLSTRLQVSTTRGQTLFGMFRHIVATEGIQGLFKGYFFNVILCTNPAIQNTTFDQMKAAILRVKSKNDPSRRASLTPVQAFLLGALSKAVATVITYPLVRIKTILQAGQEAKASQPGDQKPELHMSPLQRISQLYRGIGSALLKTVLQAALLYMMKDQIAELVELAFKRLMRPGGQSHKLRALS